MGDGATTPDATPEPTPPEEALQHAKEAGLRYITDREPGIQRVRDGATFRYVGPDGKDITDEAELTRIRKLAIPPAYEDVWICTNPRGHLLATGRDARGRKQYRYHPGWREARDGAKFERMVQFGETLPKLRRKLRRDAALKGLPQDKVLAVVVALLDSTLLRIGNAEYARTNKSYGLTTLRDRHVKFIRDGRAVLKFRGKGGLDHEIVINDRRLARLVRHCQQLPGQQLFQYIDDDDQRRPVTSELVNQYLASAMGADFTAKDFRTWGATLRAIALMSCTPLPEDASEAKLTACIVSAVKTVAAELRNTPAVCRKSYINPVVFEAWRDGRLHQIVEDVSKAPDRAEKVALKFLRTLRRAQGDRITAGERVTAGERITARSTSARAGRSRAAAARRASAPSRSGTAAASAPARARP